MYFSLSPTNHPEAFKLLCKFVETSPESSESGSKQTWGRLEALQKTKSFCMLPQQVLMFVDSLTDLDTLGHVAKLKLEGS